MLTIVIYLSCFFFTYEKTTVILTILSILDAFAESNINVSVNNGPEFQWKKRNVSFSDLGPLKDNERRDLNCAVKEYLLIAGYRLTAMTFYEEVCKTVNAPYVFAFSLFLCSICFWKGWLLSFLLTYAYVFSFS